MIIEIVFWILVGFVVYTYGVYPLIVFLLSKFVKREARNFAGETVPTVSVIIPVYNEARILREKLKNIHEVEYQKGQIEFLVGSDGSTDETNDILLEEKSPHIQCIFFSTRRGKAAVLNDLIFKAKGEIIVFSDSNTFYTSRTVVNLVTPFSDPRVGAVCGELILTSRNSSAGGLGETSY